jgi:hypothetical protein
MRTTARSARREVVIQKIRSDVKGARGKSVKGARERSTKGA